MSNGETAIVVENHQTNTLRPIVRLMDGTTLDLTEEKNKDIEIMGLEPL